MTRILIVNPNTTQAVTGVVLTEARRGLDASVALEAVTGTFGASIVSTEAENVLAASSALDLLARHHPGFDAAILAISFDTGAFPARILLPIPVVGITEAAIHTACLLGRRFGLVVLGRVSLPLYEDLVERIGLVSRLGAIETVSVSSAADYLDRSIIDRGIEDAVQRLADRGVDVAVVCGAAVAGIAHRLRDRAPILVLDGVAPAIAQARALAGLRLGTPRRTARLAAGTPPMGIGPELASLLEGSS
jgi:allantoin racemase